MKQIITSILDNDLYKFTMQNFVLQHYPEVEVEYKFFNRDLSMKFNKKALEEIKSQMKLMENIKLLPHEKNWLIRELPFLPIFYLEYLSSYRFSTANFLIELDDENNLNLNYRGKWRDKILWEVPLMAIISEVYFNYVDTEWSMEGQLEKINKKGQELENNSCKFADFGTRRRRSFDTHDLVVRELIKFKYFQGTSNPYFAMKYGTKVLGTCAHEAIGGVAALESLNHPNKVFMEKWTQTYNGRLGIMLPDTYGHKSFFKDFDIEKAKLWDGLRHDSGDPIKFTDETIDHYNNLNIRPLDKTIVFSNSLTTRSAIEINDYCKGKIDSSCGMGTHLTNDFDKSKPLNMVIKLIMANGVPVVKLGEGYGKKTGDPKMIEMMEYIHKNNYK